MNFITTYEFMNFCYEFMTCGRFNIVCKLEFTFGIPTNLINFFAFIIYDVLRDLGSVSIWCLHGRSNGCKGMLTLFPTFMSFLTVCMS